jgi:hypothetical protein
MLASLNQRPRSGWGACAPGPVDRGQCATSPKHPRSGWGACAPSPVDRGQCATGPVRASAWSGARAPPAQSSRLGVAHGVPLCGLCAKAGGRTVRWTSGKPAALNRPRLTGPGATPQAPSAPQSSAASAVRPQAAAATTPMSHRCCPDHSVATSLLLRSHEMARSPGTARLTTSLSPQ